MTFREFGAAIADGVLRQVPTATYDPPRQTGQAGFIRLGDATATIMLEKSSWRIAFSRAGGGVSMASLAGETVNRTTAENIAISIAGFLA